jgi:hypothetical protein
VAAFDRAMKNVAAAVQETCDSLLGGHYRRLLTMLLVATTAVTAVRGYALASDWEQWTVGEWLVSYGGGFVRRGLSGELLLTASHYARVPANILVFVTFVTLFVLFSLLFAELLRRKRITFWFVFLCVSPAFVLFTVYNPQATGRQELLVYVLFLLWAHASRRGDISHLTLAVFAALSFLATLVHELFFLFTPYFVFLTFLLRKFGRVEGDWRRALVIPGGALAAVLTLLLFARTLDERALCDRIVQSGAPVSVCNGILAYGDPDPVSVARDFAGHLDRHAVLALLLVFPVILLPVYLFLAGNAVGPISPVRLVGAFALFIVFSAPLFVLAVDWGRWISIHAVLLTVLCAHFLRDDGQAATAPRVRRSSGVGAAQLIAGLLILSSTLLWSVNYCCSDRFFNPFGPARAIRNSWRSLA